MSQEEAAQVLNNRWASGQNLNHTCLLFVSRNWSGQSADGVDVGLVSGGIKANLFRNLKASEDVSAILSEQADCHGEAIVRGWLTILSVGVSYVIENLQSKIGSLLLSRVGNVVVISNRGLVSRGIEGGNHSRVSGVHPVGRDDFKSQTVNVHSWNDPSSTRSFLADSEG